MKIELVIFSIILIIAGIASGCLSFSDKVSLATGAMELAFGLFWTFVGLMLLLSIWETTGDSSGYQYKTFSGEKGYSDYCYMISSGMICRKDGGHITVESYKKVGK